MSEYAIQRKANLDTFTPSKVQFYESDSLHAILIGATKAVLQYDLKDRTKVFKTEQLGDYRLPEYGLVNYLPDKESEDDISPLFRRENIRYMDFACGTGLLAQNLAPYIKSGTVIGIDISEAQIDAFKSKIPAICTLNPRLVVKPYKYDIIDPEFNRENHLEVPQELQYGSFDIITTTLSFHHFSALKQIVVELKKYLKKDGCLIVVDMYDHKDEYNGIQGAAETNVTSAVAHNGGFSPKQMHKKLDPIGFSSVGTGIKYLYEHWCNHQNLYNHLPPPVVAKALKSAPKRQRAGQTEYLVTRSLVLAICRK